jgi:Arc/MetJ-type ribon-helix-helix transcriptional regulator
MKANNSDGERITLRLEQEDLVLIDEYIEEHPEFSSRSHLARIAIRSLIESQAGEDEAVESSQKRNRIMVEIPMIAFNIIEENIKRGEFTSFQSAIEGLVSQEFLSPEKRRAHNVGLHENAIKTFEVLRQ